ncbi:MAG: 30S ribosomal protein S13 [Thermoplasmata archaeon]|nr:MAG: 30S ribosomal protein S13 [Thermoplasmata archaeon]
MNLPQQQNAQEKQDFKYIVRIADTDLQGEKSVIQALTGIKGIGFHVSAVIADCAGVNRYEKIGNLPEEKIEKLREIIANLDKYAPSWLMNRRKDIYTGKDMHLIGTDIDMVRREDINRLKKIRAYRGIRHELGLPVRGQRTRSNGRKGLALGVSRKRK